MSLTRRPHKSCRSIVERPTKAANTLLKVSESKAMNHIRIYEQVENQNKRIYSKEVCFARLEGNNWAVYCRFPMAVILLTYLVSSSTMIHESNIHETNNELFSSRMQVTCSYWYNPKTFRLKASLTSTKLTALSSLTQAIHQIGRFKHRFSSLKLE